MPGAKNLDLNVAFGLEKIVVDLCALLVHVGFAAVAVAADVLLSYSSDPSEGHAISLLV